MRTTTSSPHPLDPQPVLTAVLRCFFHHFYHGFAWTYDAVASVVSLGRWFDWINAVLPFVRGSLALELGHGTGHLMQSLAAMGDQKAIGLDESPQMARLTSARLAAQPHNVLGLVRGIAQRLPFASGSLHSVLSTFPTEFIFSRETMSEVYRVLRPGGRLVVLPVAWLVGKGLLERAAAWLSVVTRQVPQYAEALVQHRLAEPLREIGFEVVLHRLEIRASVVLVVVAIR